MCPPNPPAVRAQVLAAAKGRVASYSVPKIFTRAMSTSPQESFMSGSNSVYVEEMYRAWLQNHDRCVTSPACAYYV